MSTKASVLFIALIAAANASIAAEKKSEKAEWVKRCDRLKEERRIACLDEVRAEAQKRFDEQEAAKSDATGKTSTQAPAKTN